jgi:hypothetical protein
VSLCLAAGTGWAAEAAGVNAAPVLDGIFGPQARVASQVDGALYTPALDDLTRRAAPRDEDASARSVEAFAAKIWYAGAVLLTADRVVRSMDSVLESAQIEGRNEQRFGLDLSSHGVGMVLRFERKF